MRKIMIATGGTGGHINPALAFAEIVKKKHPETEITFIGSSDRMEAELIPAKGYEFISMEMSGMNGGIKAKLQSAMSLFKAEKQCRKLLKERKPDFCIGFGNYISVPLIMAAHKLHIPTMIEEQNSFAGKANKMLGRYADAIAGSYPENAKDFPADRYRLIGNPQATLSVTAEMPDIYDLYHFSHDLPLVFFMMGSLGSETVSAVIDQTALLLGENLQLLIAAGKSNPYHFTCENDRIRVVEYVNGTAALQQADLSVCRAGATTLCEITALGAASILIPSPYVPNNHQVFNAMELVRNDAAVMIEEKDLTAEKLAGTIQTMIDDSAMLELMKKNATKMGTPNAAYEMIDWMEDLIAHEKKSDR